MAEQLIRNEQVVSSILTISSKKPTSLPTCRFFLFYLSDGGDHGEQIEIKGGDVVGNGESALQGHMVTVIGG